MTTSFGALVKRDFINTIRNPMIIKSRIIQSIFMGIYTGGLYFNAASGDHTDPLIWRSVIGFFFFMSISSLMSSLAPVTLIFPT